MKISRREALFSMIAAIFLLVGILSISSWRLRNSFSEAENLCRTMPEGILKSDAISLANQNSVKRKLIVEQDRIIAFFGSGCRCGVRFKDDKAITRGVVLCLD